jgi:hypothetical protein
MDAAEEIVSPFPPALSAAPLTTACRSTLLLTSIGALEARGLYEDYTRQISAEDRAAITSAVAGMWLPISLGIAHYTACDRLRLSPFEQEEIGGHVVRNLQQTFLGGVLKAATTAAGISPWTGLSRFTAIYHRMFRGGGTRVVKIGPKDARADAVGLPLASIEYFRNAYRGFIRAGCQFFASRVFVKDVAGLNSAMTLSYRVSWV